MLKIKQPIFTQAETNRLLRLVEQQMESERPNFKDKMELQAFELNTPASFIELRTIHEKLHKL